MEIFFGLLFGLGFPIATIVLTVQFLKQSKTIKNFQLQIAQLEKFKSIVNLEDHQLQLEAKIAILENQISAETVALKRN
jgi:hypothetical protein